MRIPTRLSFVVPVIATLLCASVPSASAVGDPLAGAAGVGDSYYPLDGNGGYDVGHYDVAIGYDPPSKRLTGKTTITATATQALTRFNLDYNGPAVHAVSVNGTPARFEYDGRHELTVIPNVPLLPLLSFTIVVDYAGTQRAHTDQGWTFAPDGGAFVMGEPHSAATWYPVNDTLNDRATFTVHATVPAGWDVVSNGVRTQNTVAGARRTVTWNLPTPTLSYLTTVAIGHFSYLKAKRANGTQLVSAFAPGTESHKPVERRLPEILNFEEQLYGPYPQVSGGGIYIDSKMKVSLEIQSRPIYAPWTELNTVVHENAHQWWGDSVSIRSWADICLNECFASYTADLLWPERREGKNVDNLYRNYLHKALATKNFWRIPLFNPGPGLEFTSSYSRGPLFLHALRRTIGDPAFFGAVRDFAMTHRGRSADVGEFRRFIQSRTTIDLTEFFTAWMDIPAKPADRFLYPGGLHR